MDVDTEKLRSGIGEFGGMVEPASGGEEIKKEGDGEERS